MAAQILETRMYPGLEQMSSYLFLHPPTAGKPPTDRQEGSEDILYLFPFNSLCLPVSLPLLCPSPCLCSLTQIQWGGAEML